jgi:hypothetical protein
MCYQIIERYSLCRCLYHKHSVDPCRQYGQEHHRVTEKTVLVGFSCARHSRRRENLFEIPFIPPYPEACHDIGYNASIAETNSSLKSSTNRHCHCRAQVLSRILRAQKTGMTQGPKSKAISAKCPGVLRGSQLQRANCNFGY